MDIKEVKSMINRNVYFDTRQINIRTNNSIHEFIFTACILRKDRNNRPYYQAELKDKNQNSVIIVPLDKVKTKDEV